MARPMNRKACELTDARGSGGAGGALCPCASIGDYDTLADPVSGRSACQISRDRNGHRRTQSLFSQETEKQEDRPHARRPRA